MSSAGAWRWRSAAHAAVVIAGAAALAIPSCAAAGTTGGISGVATAWDGTRVANLRLTLANPVTGILTATTDRDGFFVILALPPGRYTFLGTHSGGDYFLSADCSGVEVHADQVSQVHLWLDRTWGTSDCGDVESRAPSAQTRRSAAG